MKKSFSTALLALIGFALPASAQVQANYNGLILGFRATGGQGQNTNLEVNLGSVALYTNPASSPMVVTRLSASDLSGTYGATWKTRTDLVWGIIGTAGRVSTGPTGQPAATLWATKPEATVGTQSAAWTPGSRNGQTNASAFIESLFIGAPGSLNSASASPNSSYSSLINATLAGSYTVQNTQQAGTSFQFFNPSIDNNTTIGSATYVVSDLYELQPGAVAATYVGSFGLKSDGTLVFATSAAFFTGSGTAPAVTTQPSAQSVAAGGSATLTVAASGSPTFAWQQNGASVASATSATLTLASVQPANTGLYTAVVTNSTGSTTSAPAVVGVTTTSKVIGTGTDIADNIAHPNGNIFDQVLITGAAESITADAGQVTRTSYIDLNDDIVQIEFSGAGTLSVVLTGSSGPAAPINYNQPTTLYMKGHAGLVVVGANETTNLGVFTVGRAKANDPTGAYNITHAPNTTTNNPANNGSPLFTGHSTTAYDGVADIAFVAISSTNGKFGGLRTANATYWATTGITGVYAPGVEFTGPVYVGDINAKTSATSYLTIGKADGNLWVTGGDLSQDNGRSVQVAGFTALHFKDGSTSGNVLMPAQANKGVLVQNGTDVTSQVVLAPGL